MTESNEVEAVARHQKGPSSLPRRGLCAGLLMLSLAGMALGAVLPAGREVPPAQQDAIEISVLTSMGTISIELYPERAPQTVENFLSYVDRGLFNGSAFYRAVRLDNQRATDVPIQVIQGGLAGHGLLGTKAPDSLPPIPHEPTNITGITHGPGTISMARLEPGTATSEFFITLGDNDALDAGGRRQPDEQGFAAFGRVTRGLDVVEEIQLRPTSRSDNPEMGPMQNQLLDEAVLICKVTRTAADDLVEALEDGCILGQ